MATGMTWADFAKMAGIGDKFDNNESLIGGFRSIGNALGYQGDPFRKATRNTGPMGESGVAYDEIAYEPQADFLSQLGNYRFEPVAQGQHPAVRVYGQDGTSYGEHSIGDGGGKFDNMLMDQLAPLAIAALAGGTLGGWIPGTEGAAGGLGGGVGGGAIGAGEGAAQLAAWQAANPLTAAGVAESSLAGLGNLGGYAAGGAGALGGLGGGSFTPEYALASDTGAGGLGEYATGASFVPEYGGAAGGLDWGALGKAAILPALSIGSQLYSTNQAQKAMSGATGEANALNKYMYDTTRQDNMPALQARNDALGQIQALLKDPSTLTSQPGYEFGLGQGTKALNNGAAARGMTYSGAQGKAQQKFGQDYAGTKLDASVNRLLGLAGAGQPGAGTIAGAGGNYANQTGANLLNNGAINAERYAVNGGIVGNAINGLSAYGTRQGWWG